MSFPLIQDRKKRLESINKILKERKLKPLSKLGDSKQKGEVEILRILNIHDHAKKFYTEVEFEVVTKTSSHSNWTIRWNANSLESDGNIFVIIINGLFLLTKQHRPALNKWKKELLRGFHWSLPKRSSKKQILKEIQISDVPMETLYRELGEEVISQIKVNEIKHLGNIAQNSSTDAATPSVWLIDMSADKKILEKRLKEITHEGIKTVLMTKDEIEFDIGKTDGISDALSIAGIHLAEKYLVQKQKTA